MLKWNDTAILKTPSKIQEVTRSELVGELGQTRSRTISREMAMLRQGQDSDFQHEDVCASPVSQEADIIAERLRTDAEGEENKLKGHESN